MREHHFTYREAIIDDWPQLALLGQLSYGQYASELAPEHLSRLMSQMADEHTWRNILAMAKGFVCEAEGKIMGMAFFVPSGNPWDMFKAEWCYLRMVGVHPACEGQGIASRLTSLCIAYAKATNEKTIALHTSEMMLAARHIYEKAGFKILQEIPLRLGKRYWLYTMELQYNDVSA